MHVYIKSFIHHVSPFVNGLGYMCPMEIVFLKENMAISIKKRMKMFNECLSQCDTNVIGIKAKAKGLHRFVDNASIFYVKLISSSRLYISSSDTIEVTTVDFYQSSTAHQRNIIFASQGFLV